jgi:hypothetical protein
MASPSLAGCASVLILLAVLALRSFWLALLFFGSFPGLIIFSKFSAPSESL